MLRRMKYVLQGRPTWSAKTHPAAPKDDTFRQLSFTFAVIALSARVACTDGPLTREKYVAFRESFPLRDGICGKIRALFTLACENHTPFEHYVAQIKYIFPDRRELFASLVDRLFCIAAADGSVSRSEEMVIAKIAHMLELSPADYAAIRARRHHPATARQVLGLGKRTTAGMLKARYRELLRRWHPDRFAAQDLSPEVQLLLKLKTSEINEAYRRLSKKAA